jgi:3-deoxy-7-phosphoheptulonate synthase
MPGIERVVLGALGDERVLADLNLAGHPAVESIKPILTPYKLVGRELHPHDTIVDIGGVSIGGRPFVVIAGPSSVADQQQLLETAAAVEKNGARVLRCGAVRSRRTPYEAMADGRATRTLLDAVSQTCRLPIVVEAGKPEDVAQLASVSAGFQLSSQQMQNDPLLEALAASRKPVIVQRGIAATIDEWLLTAEHLLARGNPNVILCERGIRTFETATRFTLDLSAVAYAKLHTHLPVLVDPSHATGVRELVLPLTRAAAAVGADGVLLEVHCEPRRAADDAPSLDPNELLQCLAGLAPIVKAAGRTL